METKQLTKREILEKIASTYTLETRSVYDGACVYRGPEGRGCAFAMMVLPEFKSLLVEGKGASYQLVAHGQGILSPEYRGHNIEFYSACQAFHDDNSNWTNEGLSPHGKWKIEEILRRPENIIV